MFVYVVMFDYAVRHTACSLFTILLNDETNVFSTCIQHLFHHFNYLTLITSFFFFAKFLENKEG